jgi:hypothetical protein
MTEIKERCAVLQAVADEKVNVWPVAAHELGHLQLRLICELIGLGCLAAHGDIPATYSRQLFTRYEPGRIFSELERLHPNFFPRACSKNIRYESGVTTVEILDDHQYLSKQELIALHGRTGNVLHRGALKSIRRGFQLDFQYLLDWRNRIVDLLRIHFISLHDENRYVVIVMDDPVTGAVGAAEVQATRQSDGWKAQEANRRKPRQK